MILRMGDIVVMIRIKCNVSRLEPRLSSHSISTYCVPYHRFCHNTSAHLAPNALLPLVNALIVAQSDTFCPPESAMHVPFLAILSPTIVNTLHLILHLPIPVFNPSPQQTHLDPQKMSRPGDVSPVKEPKASRPALPGYHKESHEQEERRDWYHNPYDGTAGEGGGGGRGVGG